MADRSMTTDRVGPGLHDITHDKHAYRAEIGHRNAGLRADHLLGHTRLYLRARVLETQAADRDRAELRETDVAIAVHDEEILPLGAAEQLDLEDVARPDHIIDRHRNSHDRLEGGRRRREQVVAEGLEWGLEWQQRQADPEILQQPLDRKPVRRLERRQPRHRDRGEPGQIERPGTRQTVRISATHGVDQALQFLGLGFVAVYRYCIRRSRCRHRCLIRCRTGQLRRHRGPVRRGRLREHLSPQRQHSLLPLPLQRQDLDDQCVIRLEPRLTRYCPVVQFFLTTRLRIGARQRIRAFIGARGGARRAENTRACLGPHRLDYRALLFGWQALENPDLLFCGSLGDRRKRDEPGYEQSGHGQQYLTRPHPCETLHAYS